MKLFSITDFSLKGKKILLRVDFNVPIENGCIVSDKRIKDSLRTIKYILSKEPLNLIIISHLGRPKEGNYDQKYSLLPVSKYLSRVLNVPVRFSNDYLKSNFETSPGEIILCENVRFNVGEKTSDKNLSKSLASLCDIFVMDAFASSHRAHASTYGIAKILPSCSGFLLQDELKNLNRFLTKSSGPVLALIGGSKISTKLTILKNLARKVDQLVLTGGLAITMLASSGIDIGLSIVEKDLFAQARQLINECLKQSTEIILPVDVRVSKSFSSLALATVKNINSVESDEMILDIGPRTERILCSKIFNAKTILWNGPVGVFEFENFSLGTKSISCAIANSKSFSIAGGGDTIAAIEKFNVTNKISYISTGGGAFLKVIEGSKLPAIEILSKKFKDK